MARRNGRLGCVALLLSAVWVLGAPTVAQGRIGAGLAQSGVVVDPPPVRTYPASDATVQGWIDTLNAEAIRAHGWDIWQSITSDGGQSGLPVWETWYSGQEVFPAPSTARAGVGSPPRPTFHVFERQHQVKHSGALRDIPVDQAEAVLAFNRYSASLANVIWNKRYNSAATLNALNQQFDRDRTPVVERVISTSDGPVDASQIVLKPVFEFISGSAPTAIPYWAGVSPQTTTNLDNPTPSTWRQCVIVDPTGVHRPGSRLAMPCNQEPSADRDVIPLDNFYTISITEDEARNFSSFAANSGDDLGANAQSDPTSILNMVKAGNIAVLVAMHVTTKEIPNWTWQTFWWGHNPGDVLFGKDRPPSIPAPWSHYLLDTAYYMTAPSNAPDGDPLVTFNPYLETNLSGCVPNSQASPCAPSPPQTPWTGVHTNCMTCHRMAAWGGTGVNPPYWPNGLISPDNASLFGGYTKTDFLWSIAIRAQ